LESSVIDNLKMKPYRRPMKLIQYLLPIAGTAVIFFGQSASASPRNIPAASQTNRPSVQLAQASPAEAAFDRGTAKLRNGDLEGALADYNQAIQLDPELAVAYVNRGLVRRRLGDVQGALSDYNSAINLDPNMGEPFYNRGLIRRSNGDPQGALSDFRRAAAIYKERGQERYYEDAVNRIAELESR